MKRCLESKIYRSGLVLEDLSRVVFSYPWYCWLRASGFLTLTCYIKLTSDLATPSDRVQHSVLVNNWLYKLVNYNSLSLEINLYLCENLTWQKTKFLLFMDDVIEDYHASNQNLIIHEFVLSGDNGCQGFPGECVGGWSRYGWTLCCSAAQAECLQGPCAWSIKKVTAASSMCPM